MCKSPFTKGASPPNRDKKKDGTENETRTCPSLNLLSIARPNLRLDGLLRNLLWKEIEASMKIAPLELKEANSFILKYHRHHTKVRGHRFSIGAFQDEKLVAVAIVGRPVSRSYNPKQILEITRLCSNGTDNACSFLYSAAARIGREMGYKLIQTYILETENGSSLKAAGFVFENNTRGGKWTGNGSFGNIEHSNLFPVVPKQRWIRVL